MFIKFSDKTPTIEVEEVENQVCQDCHQATIIINEEKKCGCTADNNLEKKALDFFTQKIETTNNQK